MFWLRLSGFLPVPLLEKAIPKGFSSTAPKKTWGGQWFPQSSFLVAIIDTGGQETASKIPTFLSCKPLHTTEPKLSKSYS